MAIDAGSHDVKKLTKFLYDTGAMEISLIENEEDH